MERDGVFTFSKTAGSLSAQLESDGAADIPSEQELRVTFKPPAPGNYYARIFCIVSDRTPLFVDICRGEGTLGASATPWPARRASREVVVRGSRVAKCSADFSTLKFASRDLWT